MNCPFCGRVLSNGVTFCDQCGNMLNSTPQQGPGVAPQPQGMSPQGMGMAPPPGGQAGFNQAPPQGAPNGFTPTPPPGYGGPSGYGGPPVKKSPLVPILIAAAVVAVIGLIVLLIVLFTGGDSDGPKDEGTVTEATATPEPTPKSTPEPEDILTPPEPEEDIPTPEPDIPEGPSAEEIAESYSTTDRPNVADFDWFYELYYANSPKRAIRNYFSQYSAEQITDPALVEGGWKAYMIGKQDEYHIDGYRYLNVEIRNNDEQTRAQITFDWWTYSDGSDEYNEEGDSDTTYTCSWNAAYTEFSDGQVTIKSFIEMDEVQYAYGTYVWESGEVDYIVLTREKRY